jgi:hypothetical protein
MADMPYCSWLLRGKYPQPRYAYLRQRQASVDRGEDVAVGVRAFYLDW